MASSTPPRPDDKDDQITIDRVQRGQARNHTLVIPNHPPSRFSLNMASPSPLPPAPQPADEKGDQKADRVERGQWLRAAILGANDGLLSTTSLMLGVGAAKEDRKLVVFSGVAGAFAGACSMAVGEFVSVSTQKDIEKASARRPKTANSREHVDLTDHHNNNLALSPVAVSPSRPNVTTIHSPRRSPMMKVIAEGDARMRMSSKKMVVDDHDNNDKGEDVAPLPNPYKAAAASASAFLCGSLVPILPAIFLAGDQVRFWTIVAVTSIALGMFGALGAYLGGSPIKISAMRVLVGGWFAMGITYWLLKPFHA